MARDLKLRGKLAYEVETFAMAKDHTVFRFRSEGDREVAMAGGPWVVAGQLLAMERWKPDFIPGVDRVRLAVVWIRLPNLPLEYWEKTAILRIASAAGWPLVLDGFIEQQRKMGYAWVKIEIDALNPLKPGITIRG